jgi:TetR/AcrR family transcriptional repressor of nem operon
VQVGGMATRRERADADTRTRILDVAERLVQSRGFNGFSYADVAAELKITKASLHYHFHKKAALGEALIARYAARFADALAKIDAKAGDAAVRLGAYAGLYRSVLDDQRMCLCGMLAAEYETLPEPMHVSVLRFFDDNEAWLERLLEQGRTDGSLHLDGSSRETARTIVSALEGALLVARPYHDADRFQTTADQLLRSLTRPA